MITCLAEGFPAAGLMPDDRVAFYRWMFFGAGPLEAAVTNAALGVGVPADRRVMIGYGSLQAAIDRLDGLVSHQPDICGDRFSAADVHVGRRRSGSACALAPSTPDRHSWTTGRGLQRGRPACARKRSTPPRWQKDRPWPTD